MMVLPTDISWKQGAQSKETSIWFFTNMETEFSRQLNPSYGCCPGGKQQLWPSPEHEAIFWSNSHHCCCCCSSSSSWFHPRIALFTLESARRRRRSSSRVRCRGGDVSASRWGRREAATRSQRRASCRFCFYGGGICWFYWKAKFALEHR